MRKRLGSILLVLAMVMSLLPTAVFAAAGDYDADIVATRFNTVQYNGKDTMKLDFMMKTSNGAKVRGIQTALLAIDLNKYAVLQVVSGSVYDRTSAVSTGSTVTKSNYAYTTYYDAVNDISVTAKNTFLSSGTKLLMTFEADFGANDVSITESTSMMSILLGLKDGADWASLSSDSVRLATAAEAKTFNATGALTVNPSTGSQLVFRPQNGTSDTLTNEPTVSASGFDFVKPALPNTASVAIGGTAKYGQTLTASTENLPGDAGALTYKWYREGVTEAIQSGDSNTYTINNAADVGKTIKVEVSAANYSGKMEASVGPVAKADGPAAPTELAEVSKTHNSITVTENTAWQYSRDNGANWQDSNVFEGLEPNTEYSIIARVKATVTHEASAASAALKVTTAKANAGDPVKPVLDSKTDTTIKMQAVSGQKYMIKLAAEAAPTAGGTGWSDSAEFNGLQRNTTYKVYTYIAETDSTEASVVVSTEVITEKTTITAAMVPMSGTTVTYNGEPHEPGFSGSLTKDTDYSVAYACKTDGKLLEGKPCGAGTYTITVSGKGDYTGSFTADFTVNKLPATLYWENTTGRKFGDGKTVTARVSNAIPSDTVSVEVTGGAETAVGSHTATAALTGADAGNYELPADKTKTYIISKADALTGIKAEFTLPYTTTGAQTVSLSDFNLPDTVQNASINTTTGPKTDADNIIGSYSATSFTLKDGLTDACDGKTASWTVVIQSDNYENINATVTVKTVKKTVNTTAMTVSLAGWTYGDDANTPVVTGNPNNTVTYKYSGTGYPESTTVPSNAGTYTVTATCETADTIYTATNTFTIDRKSISGATVTLDKTTTEYSGSAQTVSVSSVTVGGKTLTAADYSVSGGTSGTNVGTYTVTVTGQGNYKDSIDKTWEITKKEIEIAGAGATGRQYEAGNKNVEFSGASFKDKLGNDIALEKDVDYTGVAEMADDTANEGGKSVTITITLNGNAKECYVLKGNTYETFVSISRTEAPDPTGLTGRTGNKLSTVSLPKGWAWVDGDTVMTEGEQQYLVAYEGTVNYHPWYNTDNHKLTVTVSDKDTQTLNVPDSITATYGDTNVSVAPTGAHGALSYAVKSGSDVVTVGADGKLTFLSEGTATVTVTAAETATYAKAEKNVTINVSRKALTVTAKDQSINVNGTLPDLTKADAYTVTGLVNGDTVDVSLNYAETPDVTKTGSYDIVVTATADNSKYELTTQNGTLTITQRAISGVTISNYSVTVEKAENGAVKADRSVASAGATVTLTADPAKGYTLETLTVLDKNGKEVKLTAKDGKYTFTMPASNVVVKNTFMEDNSMLNFFVDVPASKYFYDAVLWAVKNGITGGVDENHFAPYASCTRGQLVTFLWRAAGEPAAKGDTSFSDVAKGRYCEKSVAWAAENGIVGGYNDGSFRPDATITRQQTAAILWRFAKYAKMDVSVGEDTNILSFTDALSISEYAFPGIQWAVGAGVMQGNDGALLPHDSCTRAQIVTFLYRLLSK